MGTEAEHLVLPALLQVDPQGACQQGRPGQQCGESACRPRTELPGSRPGGRKRLPVASAQG